MLVGNPIFHSVCAVIEEIARHKFLTCPIAKAISFVISQLLALLTWKIVTPFSQSVTFLIS